MIQVIPFPQTGLGAYFTGVTVIPRIMAASHRLTILQHRLPEISNLVILPTDLYNGHGIQIHVDGVYRYIRVAPPSCSNYAQLELDRNLGSNDDPAPLTGGSAGLPH